MMDAESERFSASNETWKYIIFETANVKDRMIK